MNTLSNGIVNDAGHRRRLMLRPVLAAMLLSGIPLVGHALEFNLSDGVTLNWDTQVKYSAGYRLKNATDELINAPDGSGTNSDDGNRNFKKGLINNRFDLFTEADLKFGGFGGRVSAAGWYDTVYNQGTDNTSTATSNNVSGGANQFPVETRRLLGRKTDLLDAFVFGKFDLGSVPLTFRAGRHTLYWGETFFFGMNGVAGTMGPVDAAKAVSVPGALTKEIFRPTGQVSGQLRLTSAMALGAYYQYKWERTILPPAGSYFSQGDVLDDGGYCLRFAPGVPCGTPGATLLRDADQKPKNGGQGGLQLKYRLEDQGIDLGLYATNSHAKTPYVYINFGQFGPSSYNLVFPQNIRTFGASISANVSDYQLAAELSTRRNNPLAADGQPNFSGGNNTNNPLYPVGSTAHANFSVLATLPSNFLARSTGLTAELAWNRTLAVHKNPQAITAMGSRDAAAFTFQLAPSYAQVLPGLDIDVPLTVNYTIYGKSTAIQGFGSPGAGNYSIGLAGTYLAVWKLTLTYSQWYGKGGNPANGAGQSQFLQPMKDRQYLSASIGTTF